MRFIVTDDKIFLKKRERRKKKEGRNFLSSFQQLTERDQTNMEATSLKGGS